MEIDFASAKHQKLLSDSSLLKKAYGAEGAKRITLRLQALAAARTLEDMRQLPGRCHELTADRSGQFAVVLHQGFRLIFTPNEPVPRKPDGGVDWAKVDAITILEITDYHD